jgi:hypothetical protein
MLPSVEIKQFTLIALTFVSSRGRICVMQVSIMLGATRHCSENGVKAAIGRILVDEWPLLGEGCSFHPQLRERQFGKGNFR